MRGFIKNKMQADTARPENVRVEGGQLAIEARRERFDGRA